MLLKTGAQTLPVRALPGQTQKSSTPDVSNQSFWLTSNGGCQMLRRVSALLWFVAHTKPRREKKLVEYCERQGVAATLPCYQSVHKYRGKSVLFQKPLFPGYVFLQLQPTDVSSVRQNDHVASLLDVFDQTTFARQLGEILRALETGLEVRLAPQISAGTRVRIRSGPLQGVEGLVEARSGLTTVVLRLDFINQAAAVKLDADELELL